MDLGLKGKIAAIAGASSGLGFAVAKALGEEGAKVFICSRNDENIKTAVDTLKAADIDAFGVKADVSSSGGARSFINSVIGEAGSLDILVTNAGGPPSMLFEEIDEKQWEEGFRLNLMSTINMIKMALPYMKTKKWGRIINMTSIAVKQPIDGLIISNTIRSGVIGLAKTLSRELAPYNITVNNLLPGYFLTKRVESLAEKIAAAKGVTAEDAMEFWINDIPLKRIGDPDEFGALAAFLASEKSSYMTGTSIQIDGGLCRSLL